MDARSCRCNDTFDILGQQQPRVSRLVSVTLQVGNRWVKSDGTGRFLILGLQAGKGVLLIDGTSANHDGKTVGIFQAGQLIEGTVTNVLPYTIWMPVLDMADAVTIPSPTTRAIVVPFFSRRFQQPKLS